MGEHLGGGRKGSGRVEGLHPQPHAQAHYASVPGSWEAVPIICVSSVDSQLGAKLWDCPPLAGWVNVVMTSL